MEVGVAFFQRMRPCRVARENTVKRDLLSVKRDLLSSSSEREHGAVARVLESPVHEPLLSQTPPPPVARSGPASTSFIAMNLLGVNFLLPSSSSSSYFLLLLLFGVHKPQSRKGISRVAKSAWLAWSHFNQGRAGLTPIQAYLIAAFAYPHTKSPLPVAIRVAVCILVISGRGHAQRPAPELAQGSNEFEADELEMVVEWMLRKRLVLRALIQVTQAIVPQTQGKVPLGVLPKLLKSQYPSTFTI